MTKDKRVIISKVRKIFGEIMGSALGPSISVIIGFQLEKRLNRDPFEVLWENPKAFYTELRNMFADGAEVLISVVARGLMKRYNLGLSSDEFLKLISSDDEKSKEKLHKIWINLAKSSNPKKNVLEKPGEVEENLPNYLKERMLSILKPNQISLKFGEESKRFLKGFCSV